MNPFRSNVGTLNEILFENKNKSYGAYAIRVAYENTVLKSLGLTASIILGGVWFLSTLLGKEVEVKIPVVADPPAQLTQTITINLDELKDQPKAKKDPPKTASDAIKKNIDHFVIRNKPADSANIKLVDPINGVGTGSVVSTGTSGITDPGPNTGTMSAGGEGGNGNQPYNYYEEAPECPGGIRNFWAANLHYPNEARDLGIEGKVYLNFVLDEEGQIMSCKVIKKLGYGCDEEVLRVAKLMPRWKPAKINGKAVKVTFNQAVDFRLR
jgi:protein TonB